MITTAKVILNSKSESGVGAHRQVVVNFSANYANGQNADWAKYTPSLDLTMMLNGDASDRFKIGQEYTLTFEESVPE